MIEFPERPLIRDFLEQPMSGSEIETRSLEIIDREALPNRFTPAEWRIVRRMIHTSGDFGILQAVRFSSDAVEAGIKALQACRSIYTDANMIRAGISLARLRKVCGFYRRESVICHTADQDVARLSRRTGLPRSLHAIQKAKPLLDGAIAVIGSAPVALMELNRMIIEEGLRPALIIALPVGFVHAAESKREMMLLGVPYITTDGHRWGSALAITAVHGLCGMAAQTGERGER
ncbi:MAG: precorrin-8X methylmutase [Thermodesulfobacteriota bacterium]